jgi:hypothetical protein
VKALGYFMTTMGIVIMALFIFIGGGAESLLRDRVLHLYNPNLGTILVVLLFLWPILVGLALIIYGASFLKNPNLGNLGDDIEITEHKIPDRFRDEKMLKIHSEVAARDFVNPLAIGNVDRASDQNSNAYKSPAVGEVAEEIPSGNDGHDHFGVSKRSKK